MSVTKLLKLMCNQLWHIRLFKYLYFKRFFSIIVIIITVIVIIIHFVCTIDFFNHKGILMEIN